MKIPTGSYEARGLRIGGWGTLYDPSGKYLGFAVNQLQLFRIRGREDVYHQEKRYERNYISGSYTF